MIESWKRTFPLLLVIVFGVSWVITDRVFLRATQISQGTMTPDFEPKGLLYAGMATAVFAVFFWVFIRDVSRDEPSNED